MKKGQVVLFVIIIITITLIIVTSVLNRTLTGIKTTNVNTDSKRSFNAAETGLEELLNRSDLGTFAGSGSTADIQSVDPSLFSERKYSAAYTDNGYFETSTPVAKDDELMIEFNSAPSNDLRVNFQQPACVLVAALGTNGAIARYFVCGVDNAAFSNETINATNCDSPATYNGCTPSNSLVFPAGSTPYAILIKILNNSSKIRITATNYATSFKTKNITGTVWAITKSGVKTQLEVKTKTTKDSYPVFDYALYLR